MSAPEGEWLSITSPANGAPVGRFPSLGEVKMERAIALAEQTQPAWDMQTSKARGALLPRWYDLITNNVEDLVRILAWERGKPLSEARDEVLCGAPYINVRPGVHDEFTAALVERIPGRQMPLYRRNQ